MVEAVANEWMEQLLAEHRQLRTTVAELQEYLDRPRPRPGEKGSHTWAAKLSERILHLHDELVRHFRFEEEADMVEDLTVSHPEAACEIQEVLAQHPVMLRGIRQITADVLTYSEGRRPEDPRLRQRILSLLESFSEHEQRETRLIQRLEYREFGTGD